MDLACVVGPTPAARHTKSQLQKELEAMRHHRSSTHEADEETNETNIAEPSPALVAETLPILGSDHTVSSAGSPTVVPEPNAATTPPAAAPPQVHPPPAPSRSIENQFRPINAVFTGDQIDPRMLDGQEVSGRKIFDCFNLFFTFYAPYLPILDPTASPNFYYEQSPFLFWTVVYIGSRRYPHDPTLVGRLSYTINTMAFMALESRSSPIQTIQGILLLCLWPVPVDTMHRSISLVLGGATLYFAMQIGLHVAGVGQDFARTVVSRSRSEKLKRALLWKLCCAVCYSTGLCEGILPLGLTDALTVSVQGDGESTRDGIQLPQELKFRLKLHDVMTCATEMVKKAQRDGGAHYSSTLLSCISIFDTQLQELAPQAQNTLDNLHLHCYRVHLLAYHFLVGRASRKPEGFACLYSAACTLITTVCQRNIDERTSVKYCPVLVHRSITLAAMAILKLNRSELAVHLDLEAGERAYFAAIVAAREMSLLNNDLCARGASILSQLWNSRTIFKKQDGTIDSLTSRICSRLSMSVMFDCLWWWRQEFGGLGNPYPEDSRQQNKALAKDGEGDVSIQHNTVQDNAGLGADPFDGMGDDVFAFTDSPFMDYNWTTSLDFNGWAS
ncbi:Regulatory LEU3-like protein [Cladobotryum mycophilum]|uniref:Regulatory LEU3-like protein n=1 Tax=Cladobotryum mycophilum TaxID=491253 RepID=A0ABR0SW33_9HYPO